MQVENEKWFMQSFATGLRGKERKQQAAGPRCLKQSQSFQHLLLNQLLISSVTGMVWHGICCVLTTAVQYS